MIKWDTYLWDKEIVATDKEVSEIEKELNIKFPEYYLSVAKHNQGRTPEPCVFKVGEGSDVFNHLLHFKNTGSYATYSILATTKVLSNFLPENIIPIAETPGGNYICYKFCADEQASIVHVNHELPIEHVDCITKVADNFSEFLNRLSDD